MIRAILLATGLLTGPIHMAVDFAEDAGSQPHSVEILLDGGMVALLNAAPWQARFDLGDELKPRRLLVISRDAAGAEIDRKMRWLNLHEPPEAEARGATPLLVFFDPVSLAAEPTPEQLQGAFEVDGRPADVIEVSRPDAELWIVRDPNAQTELDRGAALAVDAFLDNAALDGVTLLAGMPAPRKELPDDEPLARELWDSFPNLWEHYLRMFPFEPGTQIRLVSPHGAPVSQIERPRHVLGTTQPLPVGEQGLLFHAYTTRPLSRWFRLADAVGLAGLESTARVRRRAVLLLTAEPDQPDESLYDARQIRDYLDQLRVPLFAWSLSHQPSEAVTRWGAVRPAAPSVEPVEAIEGEPAGGSLREFEVAYSDLMEALLRQRIVWIRGRHLPSEVTLTSDAVGVRLHWLLADPAAVAPAAERDR